MEMEGKGAWPCPRLRNRSAGRNSRRPVTLSDVHLPLSGYVRIPSAGEVGKACTKREQNQGWCAIPPTNLAWSAIGLGCDLRATTSPADGSGRETEGRQARR